MTKLSNLVLLALSVFFLASCNDEASPENLIGTWEASEFVADVETTVNTGGMSITSATSVAGSNFDYELEFKEVSYATSGAYDVATEVSSDGRVISNTNDSYKNVVGEGSYTASGDTITINGNFFEFKINGFSANQFQASSVAKYEIDGDKLIFTQEEVSTTSFAGSTSTNRITSKSVWIRK